MRQGLATGLTKVSWWPEASIPLYPEVQGEIARNIKVIEWAKAELVGAAGDLLQSMWRNDESATADHLAAVIGSAYLLARRLGIDEGQLDQSVRAQIAAWRDQDREAEQWFGDLSELLAHLSGEKR